MWKAYKRLQKTKKALPKRGKATKKKRAQQKEMEKTPNERKIKERDITKRGFFWKGNKIGHLELMMQKIREGTRRFGHKRC